MTVAELVGPHLPYLRRFSRALSGSQKSGNSYVEALLEAIVVDPSTVTAGARSRGFPSMGSSAGCGNRSASTLRAASPRTSGRRRRKPSSPASSPGRARPFFLTAVEGFSIPEAAEILRTDEDGVTELLDEAAREIGAMMATDVLIIEDEPLIAMDIEDIVTRLGHRVIGVARTRSEAVKLAQKTRPGIILADIQLADGSSGIDAVNDLLADFEAPVIFITAFPERLLTGNRPEPTFLITKPFAPDMVKAMISQALFFDSKSKRPMAADT